MRKQIVNWAILLAMLLTLLAPAAAAAEDTPDWNEAYREFIVEDGYLDSDQEYGYTDYGETDVQYDKVAFGLFDLDGDGVPELIAYRGAIARAFERKYIYTFADGEVQFLGDFGAYEGEVLYIPGAAYGGLFDDWMQMGMGEVRYADYADGDYQDTVVYGFELHYVDIDLFDLDDHYFTYEQQTEDDVLNRIATNLYRTYDNAGYDEETGESRFPYILPVYKVSDILSMGWGTFVEEYETRTEKLNALPKYTITRMDQSFTLPGEERDFESINYYDCVEFLEPETDVLEDINDVLRTAAETFLEDSEPDTDFDWEDGPPSMAYYASYVDNYSVALTKDYISVCNMQTTFYGGDGDAHYFTCFNYDLESGEPITLDAYLGLDEEETKAVAYEAAKTAGYPRVDDYFDRTDVSDYKFYIDLAGAIHLVFGVGEIADHVISHVDLTLDYTPKPQIKSQQTEEIEDGDEKAAVLSVHTYDDSSYEYDWEYSDDDGEEWRSAECEEPQLVVQKDEAVEGRLYRCTISNDAGSVVSEPMEIPSEMLNPMGLFTTLQSGSGTTNRKINTIVWIILGGVAALLAVGVFLVLRNRKRGRPEFPTDPGLQEFCGRCGAPRSGANAFCTACGNPYQDAAQGKDEKRPKVYCRRCGAGLTGDSGFCVVCGAKLPEDQVIRLREVRQTEQNQTPVKPAGKNRVAGIIAIVLAVLVAAGAAWYFLRPKTTSGSVGTSEVHTPSKSGAYQEVTHGDHTYQIFDMEDIQSWDDAKAYCEAQGGHLATITSKEENDFIYSYLQSCGLKTAYFGFSDAENEGDWVWVTGEDVDYTNWYPNEPNDTDGGEDEAAFYFVDDSGRWFDGTMGVSNGGCAFVCEWESGAAASALRATPTPTPTPTPPPEPTKAPADLSFRDISELIQEAAELYCGVFLWQDSVDTSDTIDQDYGYYRVREANSKAELYQLCLKHYSKECTDEMFSYHDWIERNGKLYVSRSMGLGGPVTEQADISIHRDSDTQYTIHFVSYFNGASGLLYLGESDIHLNYLDGCWVWDDVFDNDAMDVRQA